MQNETRTQFRVGTIFDMLRIAVRRGRGHLLSYAWNRFCWKCYPKLHYVSRFPLNVDIEASSRCNMRCDHCFRQYMDIKENQNMDFDLFRKIADECGKNRLYTLKFSMRGEPLMSPDIARMIAYAKQVGIKEVWVNTNGMGLTEEMSLALINANLDWLTVSFDGLGKMYESIRIPAKYEEQLEKLRSFRMIRDKNGRRKPLLNVQTLWSPIQDNPDDYYNVMQPIADSIAVNPDMHFDEITLIPDPEFCCPRLWQRLAITSTGDVLRCPSDFQKEDVMRNVRSESIREIWHGEHFRRLRELHLSGRRLEDPICTKCHHGSKKVETIIHVKGRESVVPMHEYGREFRGHGLRRQEKDSASSARSSKKRY